MSVIAYVVGVVVLGLYGALKWALFRLNKAEAKTSELELKLSQNDYDEAVDKAKQALEEAEKGE